MRYWLLFSIMFLFNPQGHAEEQDWDLSICNDSLYMQLKAKDLKSMDQREYDYFTIIFQTPQETPRR